ncbi:putative necrosis-inducing factor-domain-containing protein [Aspergillus tetrazonus]
MSKTVWVTGQAIILWDIATTTVATTICNSCYARRSYALPSSEPLARHLYRVGTVTESVNVVELDLVFPRNESYAPTEDFPVAFAVKNTQHAELLNLRITYKIFNWDDKSIPGSWPSTTIPEELFRLDWTNLSDPYLAYRYYNGTSPGHCDGGLFTNTYSSSRMFTIQHSASEPQKEVDLAAATAVGKCDDHGGSNAVGINVTDTTMNAPSNLNWADRDKCVLTRNTTSTTPASSPDPCLISISSEAAASMSAHLFNLRCSWIDPPENCPRDDENTAQPMVFLGVTGLLVVAGGLGLASARQYATITRFPYITSGSNYYGITKDDLVIGSVRTWIKHGRENPAKPGDGDPTNDDVITDLTNLNVTAPGYMRIPVCSAERAFQSWKTQSNPNATPHYSCDIPAGKGNCGESTFVDQTSDASPKIGDCRQIILNIQDDGSTDWTTQVVGKNQREIASHASCHFGVEATKVDGNVNFVVGGQDVIDIINDVIAQFGNKDGLVGSKGEMSCNGNVHDQAVSWGIY